MSFAKTKLSRAKDMDDTVHTMVTSTPATSFTSTRSTPTSDAMTMPTKKRRKLSASSSKASTQEVQEAQETQDKKPRPDIRITTKRIVGEGKHHVWIHMVGTGEVRVDLVMKKMEELQDIMDNIKKNPCLQFTFVFDFRTLDDFADYSTIFKFGAFMKRNQDLFERRLRKSYLLLRYWTWRATVRLLFAAFRPTKPVEYDIPKDIDQAICQ